MSIKSKILGALFLLAIVSAVGSAWVYRSAQVDQVILSQVSARFENAVAKSAELAVLIKDVQINVIQVQQFLTDISATRGLDGLDDGATVAAEHAKSFAANIEESKKLASLLGLKDVSSALDDTSRAFPNFYDAGQKMADAYIKGGPAAGNKLMGQFDSDSQKLGDAMDELTSLSKEMLTTSIADIQSEITEVNDKAKGLLIVTAIMGSISVLTCLAIAALVQGNVLRPLLSITSSMGQLAAGRLEINITGQKRTDEIGEIARALATFKTGLLEADNLRAAQSQQKARAEAERHAAMTRLADDFEAAVGSVTRAVADAATQLRGAAKSMSAQAHTATERSRAAASVSDQMKQDVGGVSEASGQLTLAVQEISRQISTATGMTGATLEAANTTTAKVDQLSVAAQQISAVTKTISDIASQTNLLALNATIEAARAGESGKGFAVVAGEVKALSNQTGQATERIGAEINNIQNVTQECVRAIKEISDKILELNSVSSTIAAAVEEQTASTQEISRNVHAAAAGTADVSANIDEVCRASEMTGQSAQEVLQAAEQLSQQAALLNSQMSMFLNNIRKG